jgi:hypothetical protein
VGEPLGLVGHGIRARQVRGSIEPGGVPAVHTVWVRRYRCRHCSATVTVIPRGCVPARHYGAGAIALAFVLYGLEGKSLTEAREQVSPWRSSEAGWPSMFRWLDAVEGGRLFPSVRPCPSEWNAQGRAERVAQAVLAVGLSSRSPEARIFEGAARLACG